MVIIRANLSLFWSVFCFPFPLDRSSFRLFGTIAFSWSAIYPSLGFAWSAVNKDTPQ
ncbi:hypothetical protein CPB86DRAFT_778356 [Serendipita vermifera]|nr:hypothetical protein CPB86DRAFT_778356 [Serendipita vermifera]